MCCVWRKPETSQYSLEIASLAVVSATDFRRFNGESIMMMTITTTLMMMSVLNTINFKSFFCATNSPVVDMRYLDKIQIKNRSHSLFEYHEKWERYTKGNKTSRREMVKYKIFRRGVIYYGTEYLYHKLYFHYNIFDSLIFSSLLFSSI